MPEVEGQWIQELNPIFLDISSGLSCSREISDDAACAAAAASGPGALDDDDAAESISFT